MKYIFVTTLLFTCTFTNAQNNGIDPNFYYEIDYRILPGYPAIFPNAFN